jgi:two-component system NtrC family sensor kinase
MSGTFAILVVVYFSIVNLNESMLNREIEGGKNIITNAYIEPLWSFDKTQIEEVSNTFLNDNGFVSTTAIKVVDPKGKVLFYKSTISKDNLPFENYANMPFTKTTVSEIKKNGEVLGSVYIAFTTSSIMSMYKNFLGLILLFTFFILGIISICLNLFFNKVLTTPFNQLLDHIKQIRNENYERKIYPFVSHEMQLISNAINYTSHLINKRNNDLKNYTENLEKMVDERTSELESQVIKNISVNRLVAVGEVASGIAHEINNPLTVINGQILKLKRQLKNSELDAECEASINKISLMSERIVKIINGLKLISRDGHADPMVQFSIRTMIEEIVLLTEMKIKSMDIQFDVQIDPSIEFGHGREVQISQVLVNLVNNSVDAISTEKEKWIKIVVSDHFDSVQFSITDSGHGIAKDMKEKIMLPFFTTKQVGKGTGLGLSISKGIIKEHGGDLVCNDQCPNTQFAFTLSKFHKKNIAA